MEANNNKNLVLYYCYDAYCGWCYGNSLVMRKIFAKYHKTIHIEVLSGGMITPEKPIPISNTAPYIKDAYKRVQEMTGMQFGEDYLWHINNPEQSDWFPNSEKPAIALSILKEQFPAEQVLIAGDFLYSLHHEGRDLTDDEAYRHLLEKYKVDVEDFYTKLKSEEYKDKAHYEFALCKQLQVQGFPALLLQTDDTKFYAISNGYTSFENVEARIEKVLAESI